MAVLSASLLGIISPSFSAETQMLELEKDELKLGFIKLTDMAPSKTYPLVAHGASSTMGPTLH